MQIQFKAEHAFVGTIDYAFGSCYSLLNLTYVADPVLYLLLKLQSASFESEDSQTVSLPSPPAPCSALSTTQTSVRKTICSLIVLIIIYLFCHFLFNLNQQAGAQI